MGRSLALGLATQVLLGRLADPALADSCLLGGTPDHRPDSSTDSLLGGATQPVFRMPGLPAAVIIVPNEKLEATEYDDLRSRDACGRGR